MNEIASALQRVGVRERDFEAIVTPLRPRPRLLAFGVFELDTMTCELRKEGRLVRLRPQPASVLMLLLERAGDLVTRRELTEALWPDDVDVDVEQGLNHCMKEIRGALGDRPDSPRFIQTLPRRGYRFLLEVRGNGWDKRSPAQDAPEADTAKTLCSAATPDPDPDADQGFGDGRFE